MKRNLIIAAAFAALSFVSCIKENDLNGPVTVFNATQEGVTTKTVIGAADADGSYQPLWTKWDVVGINTIASSEVELINDGKSAKFTFTEELNPPYFAVTPATAFDKREFNQGDNRFRVFVSGTGSPQKYTKNGEHLSYSANAALMVARSENTDLEFRHLMAYYKLTISGGESNIKTIYVRQNGDQQNIAGSWNVSYDENGDYSFYPYDLTSIIQYNCGDTGVEPGTPVLVGVPAYDFENGLILTVKDVNGRFQSYAIPATSSKRAGKAGVIINKSLVFAPQSGSINSAADWEAFAKAVNSETNDWDLYRWVGNGTVTIGADFTIENPTQIVGKKGKFMYNLDGQGHTVTITNGRNSLIRGVRTEVKNLIVAGTVTPVGGSVSAIADSLLVEGSIVDCTNKATLSSTYSKDQYGAGIVRVAVGGTISGCKNEGDITVAPGCATSFAACYCGGIVAKIDPKGTVTIRDCSNNAAILVKPTISNATYNINAAGIAGIAGWITNGNYNVTFDNCDNLTGGDITISSENITVAAAQSAVCVGGIVGIAAGYSVEYHALSTPSTTNGLDVTLTKCDNAGDIYNCMYMDAHPGSSNAKVYTAGIAGAIMGKGSKYAKISECTVKDCSLIPYDIVGGSDKAGYCGVVGGMIGFGGYVEIDKCVSKPIIGNGKRQSVSFAGVLGFALRPFKLTNSYIRTEGYFNRLPGYQSNRASVAVVPIRYATATNISPAGNVEGSIIQDCKVSGALHVSTSSYDDTNTSDLSEFCSKATLFGDFNGFKSNLVTGQGFTANSGVTSSGLTLWDGTLPSTLN